jgi:uncharacterized membrane protein YebE (DUF533 family)
MASQSSYGAGPAGQAVAVGAIATSSNVDNENNSVNTDYNYDQKLSTQVQTAYGATIGLGAGASGNTLTTTTTDFGAIAAAQNIATTALQTNAQGYSLLTSLTGRALNDVSSGLKSKLTPLSETISKYALYIISAVVLGIVAIAFFRRAK